MTELSRMVVAAKRASLLVVCIVLGACHSRSPLSTPSILFDGVPRADVGGPDKLDNIKGRVIGFQPGQQIVLYAKSEGLWWIQPFTDRGETLCLKRSRSNAISRPSAREARNVLGGRCQSGAGAAGCGYKK